MDADAECQRIVGKHAAQLQERMSKLVQEQLYFAAIELKQHTAEKYPVKADNRSSDRRLMFHEKQFEVRESLLTDMLQHRDESYRSIYHAMIATLIWVGVKLILQDYRSGSPEVIHLGLLQWSFDKTDVVMRTWVCMQLLAFLPLPLIQLMKTRPDDLALFKRLVIVYLGMQLTLYFLAGYTCLVFRLPPASGLIVMCEAARLSMKMHAYLREKVVHGLRHEWRCLQESHDGGSGSSVSLATQLDHNVLMANEHVHEAASGDGGPLGDVQEGDSPIDGIQHPEHVSLQTALAAFADFLPPEATKAGITIDKIRAVRPIITIGGLNEEVNRYIYFCFAPTLVYRDEYPRLPGPINWIKAGIHALNLVGVVAYTYVVTRGILTPMLGPIPPKHPVDLLLLIQSTMLPAMLVFLLSFFGILHSWLNVWAELLSFGDRKFYDSWWTSTSWGSYYRRWNMVVGDWLHSYVYNDLQRGGIAVKNRAQFGVFIISSIMHEVVLACAFRFWYPALLIMFGGPGVYFTQLTRRFAPRLANVFMWLMLSVGLGMLTVMYSRELYARYGYEWTGAYQYDPALHPAPEWGITDYIAYILVPRSWLEFYKNYSL